MHTIVNLVATRQKAGTPAELLRWYNDHVNLLMGFDDLSGATLYRRALAEGAAHEYLCLYDFPSLDAFAAFETSSAKEHAKQVTESGWGKQGIEVTQRTQYVAGGKWTGQTPPATGFYIQCLAITSKTEHAGELNRWLAGNLYRAAARANVSHYEWYVSPDQQQVVVLAAGLAALAPAWHTWWDAPTAEAFGQAPMAVAVKWQAAYERACAWRR